MTISLLATFFIFSISNARPTLSPRKSDNSNPTPDAESGWVSGPTGRGTWGLILGCLTTLSLCAWTAYHPNISPHNSPKATFFRRLKWMIAAVCVPELVLYCAWEQRRAVRKLRNEINTLAAKTQNGEKCLEPLVEPFYRPCRVSTAPSRLEEASGCFSPILYSQPAALDSTDFLDYSKASTSSQFEPWTIEQAFFAVCGGFAVDSSSFWPEKRLTFTLDGILELAKAGILPKTSNSEISDKSKANIVAKLLVCIQAGWFIVQCVARLVQGLPLTLLEIHVLTHVVCAFLMYFFWIDKPYDVGQPIFFKDENVVNFAALFAVDVHLEDTVWGIFTDRRFDQVEIKEVRAAHASANYTIPRTVLGLVKYCLDNLGSKHIQKEDLNNFEDPTWKADGTPETAQKITEHHIRANRALDRLRLRHRDALSKSDEELPQYNKILRYAKPHIVFKRSNLKIDGATHVLESDRRAPQFEDAEGLGRHWITFGLVCAIYGGAHLSAWAAYFPTTVEKWCWRASGIVLAALPLDVLANLYSMDLFRYIYLTSVKRKSGRRTVRLLQKLLDLFFDVVMVAHLLITFYVFFTYVVARLYILVEGFASLRDPPAGTYQDVKWANLIPHAG
ncbi:uncharacterized protein K452DRAFT_290381 [Aplosporella prunicola CBS 121167]|uniref:Ion transport domain-containing protein n=1 Tax=Aplosporella prunicola CBS 121167 TaxID=1176127 RepID=A0A6A6B7F1_9PEZI|nr:uncharacterized protein K452DRAFT_290381 [Aplosporella prunicola CBS 121167]KAF2138731.1 hypothetical protein K452DRAFT_290381 [Aplosporella prunicola CBS 121167]